MHNIVCLQHSESEHEPEYKCSVVTRMNLNLAFVAAARIIMTLARDTDTPLGTQTLWGVHEGKQAQA